MSFENNIKSWVSVDNQIKQLNDRVRELRDERLQLGNNIFQYVESEQLKNATVQISDGKLRFIESTQTSPLTLTFIKQCLTDCIKTPSDVETIMTYIKKTRIKKNVSEIKRTYTNNNE